MEDNINVDMFWKLRLYKLLTEHYQKAAEQIENAKTADDMATIEHTFRMCRFLFSDDSKIKNEEKQCK